MNDKTIGILEKLIVVCKDGAECFELAATEINSSLLQSLFRGYSLQRARFAGDLQAAVAALGKSNPPESGVAGPTDDVPRAEGSDYPRDEQTVLSVCERQEEATEAAFVSALAESDLPSGVRTLLLAQAAEVKSGHKEIRDLLNRFVTVTSEAKG